MKAAATLDGNLSTQIGDSKWITSDAAKLMPIIFAIPMMRFLVGVQTVLHVNPFLTTRLPHGGKNPIRIMLDRCLRTPKTAHVITDGTTDSAQSETDFSEYPLATIRVDF